MKLEGTPVGADQIDLHLTIHFNEQCERLPNGSVAFGLKGGKLKLKLENGKIPYEFRDLTSSLELSVYEQRQEPQGSRTQSQVDTSASEGQAGAKTLVATDRSGARINRIGATCQVTTKGSPQDPAWIFAVESEPILQGSLKTTKLATLHAIALPCLVEATFEVSLRDIYITESEGWSQNLNRNQIAVLKQGIARLLLKHKLQPYLSRVELRYE